MKKTIEEIRELEGSFKRLVAILENVYNISAYDMAFTGSIPPTAVMRKKLKKSSGEVSVLYGFNGEELIVPSHSVDPLIFKQSVGSLSMHDFSRTSENMIVDIVDDPASKFDYLVAFNVSIDGEESSNNSLFVSIFLPEEGDVLSVNSNQREKAIDSAITSLVEFTEIAELSGADYDYDPEAEDSI